VDKAEDAGFRRGFSGKTNSEMFGKVEIGGKGLGLMEYLFEPGLFLPLVTPNKNGLQTRFGLGACVTL